MIQARDAAPDDAAADDAAADDAFPGNAAPPAAARARRPKRFRTWRRAFFALIVAAVVAAASWALFLSPWLVVRTTTVTGNHLVSRSEVLATAGVEPGTPLIRVNTGRVAARVGAIGPVASARVSRSWPDRLVITIRERTPALAVTAAAGGYDLVDAHGVLVRWIARRPAGLPLYSAAAAVSSPGGNPDIAAAITVLNELPAGLRQLVRSVAAPSVTQVTLQLAKGVTVLWGSTAQAAAKAGDLDALLPTHATYYDVSDPGAATTK